jgi:hypothetical protein
MSQSGTNQDRFGGEYMIQDRDHMSEIADNASRRGSRQVEQSHSSDRQQGDGNDNASKRQGARRRQAH